MADLDYDLLVIGSGPGGQRAATQAAKHGRYLTFHLAEVAIPRRLFAEVLRLIIGLRPRPAPT